jgi:hypothetical protein
MTRRFAGNDEVGTDRCAGSHQLTPKAQVLIQIGLLGLVFTIFLAFGLHDMTDSKYSMLVSENLIVGHTFVIDGNSVPHSDAPLRPGANENVSYPYQFNMNRGRLLYWYPVGSSLLSLPVVALMNAAGISARSPGGRYNEDGDRKIQETLAALLMAGLTVIFFRTALLLLPPLWSMVMALGAAFSTQMWSTASRVLWSHTWQIFLIGLAIYLLLSAEVRKVSSRPMVLATILSWAYFVRPTSAIPIAAVTAYVLFFRRREFPALTLTGLCWLVLFVIYSLKIWGTTLPDYYLFARHWENIREAIAGDLISPSRGLFVNVPASAFALCLIGYYWPVLPYRRMGVLALVIVAIHLVVTATDQNWWGGHCYGARLTTDVVPWIFLLAIQGIRCLVDEPRPRLRRRIAALGLATLVIGAFINGRGALSIATDDWVNGPPDVDQDSHRVWEWSDAQFLAGLRFSGRDGSN